MSELKNLTGKALDTVRQEGIGQLGRLAGAYMKKRMRQQKRKDTMETYYDVLFINGCDARLPHPGRYRVSHQREQLEANGITSQEVYFADLDLRQVRQYSVFVFFRCPWTETIGEFVQKAKSYGKTVLYDIDDLVFDTKYTDTIPYVNSLDAPERKAYDDNVRAYGQLLDLCQGAVTTTAALAEALKNHVPEVLINRNRASEAMMQLSAAAWKERKKCPDDGKVRLGYFSGSITHNPDIEMILPVLEELMEQYRNLELVTVGELELPTGLRKFGERILVKPFTDWKNLPRMICEVDINLAPLEDTVFNRAKSENKWMEAALVQVVTVASDLGAFAETIQNGVTGYLCSSQEEWKNCLSMLIEQKELRQAVGYRAWERCRREYLTLYTGKELSDFIRSHRRKNAGILLPALNISGGIMVAMWHAIFLRESGYDVTILSENTRETACTFENQEFPVLPLKEGAVNGYFQKMIATMWVTEKWLHKFPNIKEKYYLVQNYETDFYEPGSIYRTMANATYCQNGIRYVTISRWCQNWLKDRFGQESVYAPNGLNTTAFTWKRRDYTGKIRILIEGDCGAEHKNVDEAFQIVENLDPDQFEIWYLSYNSSPKDWYRVDRFFQKIPFAQVPKVYQECHILLKTSVLESFSYPPLEMMATGGIAVVRPNGGNAEYLRDGENCLLYDPKNPEEAVACIYRIVEDTELRTKLLEGGKQTAGIRDWKNVKQEILNLYDDSFWNNRENRKYEK